MRILPRHFLASYLKRFAVILFSSVIAIAVIEMMLHFESFLEHRNGGMGFATYLLHRIPSYYFRDLLPIASFAAALCSIGLPARSHEITAIKSGGISPTTTVIPLLIAAAVLAGFTLLLNESVVLWATRTGSTGSHSGEEVAFRHGSFWYHREHAIYSVREADREARLLRGVSVFALTPRGRLLQIVRAERVEVDDDRHWRFIDATSRTFDPEHPARPPRTEHFPEWNREVASDADLALLEAGVRTLPLAKLSDYIDTQARAGRDTARYRALYHARLSDPISVLLFAFLAVALGLAVGPSRSLAASTVSGVAILASYYTARTAGEILAGRGLFWSASIPWLILAAFVSYGVWEFRRASR